MNRKYVFYVYDLRTIMNEFVASFAVREHAEIWGKTMFGEYSFVTTRNLHQTGHMWNGEIKKEMNI